MLWYALCLCYALLSPYACPVHTFAHCNCCVWCLQNTKHSALTWFSSTILIIVILCSPFTRKSSRHSASLDEWKCSFMQTIRIYLIASVSCFAQKIQQSCWWICVACLCVCAFDSNWYFEFHTRCMVQFVLLFSVGRSNCNILDSLPLVLHRCDCGGH